MTPGPPPPRRNERPARRALSAEGAVRNGRGGRGRPAAVLWDMDGTLVDSERLWDVSLAELAVSLGGQLSPSTRTAMVGTDMATTLRMMFDEVGREATPAAVAAAWDELTERTARLFATDIPWLPGAAAALADVCTAGLPAALVTSTTRDLTELALDTIGRQFFDATVCGDEVRHTKPHPEPYLRAAALLGVDAADCVAVEDSPNGATSAEAAGCTVVVVASEVSVPDGPRRIAVPSLVGVGSAELATAYHRGRSVVHDPVEQRLLGSP
ncbi:MAG: HAD family phosphatase [Pseudonocardiales bacterium]|nr:HAD family phosphatase [Pseudonocardiales bacterium]